MNEAKYFLKNSRHVSIRSPQLYVALFRPRNMAADVAGAHASRCHRPFGAKNTQFWVKGMALGTSMELDDLCRSP